MFIEKCKKHNLSHILDIGAGFPSYHANDMRSCGLTVITNDFFPENDLVGDYNSLPPLQQQFDGIWCSHTLEHQQNVGMFLSRIHSDVKEGGLVCITVPPAKSMIVGGHVSLWNAGLLLYNLILAKFDCSQASVLTYDYNISVIVTKKTITLPKLTFDSPDIDTLKLFFPSELRKSSFDGNIKQLNWVL